MSSSHELRRARSSSFRRALAARFLQAMAIALPGAALAVASSCGNESGGDQYRARECFPWPAPTAGGAGGATVGGDDAGPLACPSREDAYRYITTHCEISVQGDGVLEDGACCYEVLEGPCSTGRPYLVGGAPRAAAPARGAGGWQDAPAPRLDGLSTNDRAALASAWAADGLFEHASVASFGRFALELLALGAPADLIEAAHRAALDEVRHARLCLALASAYAGEPIAPGPFPFGGPVDVSADLADVAARAAREGCVDETLAAVQASEQLARAEDPAVRAVLAIVAADEARHAELAWRTVAWAIRHGGARVSAAVTSAMAGAIAEARAWRDPTAVSPRMAAHGRLDAATRCRAVARAIAEVVTPCAAAFHLLG